MRNHGFTVTRATLADPFEVLYFFEKAAQTQILAFSSGKPWRYSATILRKPQRKAGNPIAAWRKGISTILNQRFEDPSVKPPKPPEPVVRQRRDQSLG
jgi:hypothetical protein